MSFNLRVAAMLLLVTTILPAFSPDFTAPKSPLISYKYIIFTIHLRNKNVFNWKHNFNSSYVKFTTDKLNLIQLLIGNVPFNTYNYIMFLHMNTQHLFSNKVDFPPTDMMKSEQCFASLFPDRASDPQSMVL